MSPDDPRHGTTAGYQRHRRDSERPCPPCREANRLYIRQRRADNPEAYARDKAGTRAASRALWRLADMHRDEFDRLFADELRAENIRGRRAVAS